ncbi:RNAPII degradation factor [Onygenales sp. PD_40]|nr:RNAPII degradation factor [Onygenales sp. PD_40]
MSEVQSRPLGPRGRGSARGGRGGYSSRGGRPSQPSKQDSENNHPPSYEDEGEIGQLKKKYAGSLSTIKELFPDWTDEDLVFALEDADGDLEIAIERISEGAVSQWGEVKKKHTDRSRAKAKEAPLQTESSAQPPARGGRGRGGFDNRGRARGDRGRGGRGGRAGTHINGTRTEKPSAQPAEESEPAPVPDAWGKPEAPANEDNVVSTEPAAIDAANEPAEKAPPKSSLIPEGSKKGWASLFTQPAPPPPQKKAPPPAAAAPAKPAEAPVPEKPVQQPPVQPEPTPQETAPAVSEPAAAATPVLQQHVPVIPKDELTQTNLEQVPDVSTPHVSTTAASTVASTQDQSSTVGVSAPQKTVSGYAATAYKATTTGTPGRPSTFQRRVMEQQEAVVMPGNHAVDRAAVQFGSMGLNGPVEDLDIDEEREQPETRPQPPQHSPVAPRASLPPSTQAQAQAPAETIPVPRAAPGLPPAPATTAADASFNDFGRYAEAQKPYDPFSQQVDQTQQQTQEPFSNQAPIPSQPTATTAADYSAFYGGDQARNPYYYGSYGQSQDAQQRAGSGFGVSGADVQPQVASTQPPSRYSHVEAPNSGQNTPNPTLPGQTAQPSQHMPQGQGAHGAYNYGYPYYSQPHYGNSYMNQMGQHQYGRSRGMYDDARRYEDHYLQGSHFYGNQYGPYGGKGGMYGQPQQHGFSYDHTTSPANAGAFNQGAPGRETGYGRAGSTQPSEGQQSSGHTAFGGIPDVFGRTQSGFVSQPIAQQQPASAEEAAKGFEAPKAGGPSPSLAQANRPGSATNSAPGQPQAGQTGLPPAQAQAASQQAFGGYPQLNPQYGGLGGLGAHHQAGANPTHHQGSQYGNYGAGFSGNYYGGNTGRGGGWGGNYGH